MQQDKDKIWLTSMLEQIRAPMQSYKVLIVDDHRIVAEGVSNLIKPPFKVVSICSSGQEALELLKREEFQILLTDYEMPGLTGHELAKAAKTMQPEIKVIILSMHDDSSIVKELLKEGVNGYILKKDTHRSLAEALNKVIDNKRYLSDEIAEILIYAKDEEEKGVLTARELEIIKLVAKEFNSRQIGEILFISERTVETHRKNILKKTGASNLVGLIKYAYANNLI